LVTVACITATRNISRETRPPLIAAPLSLKKNASPVSLLPAVFFF
jgi:hypothetical protein